MCRDRSTMQQMVNGLRELPMPDHIRRYAAQAGEMGYDPVIGSMAFVDAAATRRGLDAVRSGRTIDLARPIRSAPTFRGDGGNTFDIRLVRDNGDGPNMGVFSEYFEMFQHGMTNTHIEGINHMLWDGTVYGGHAVGSPEAAHTDIMAWAERGWVTRGVLVDIPALRGTDYVDWDTPVTGDEIEACLASLGTQVHPGDAAMVHMGYEAAVPFAAANGIDIDGLSDDGKRPGIGTSAAEWIVDNRIGLLVYDFEDAVGTGLDHAPGQLLTWAVGQGIVASADLSRAAALQRAEGTFEGMLTVSPLKIPKGTGSPVNPLWIV